ncbi:MAG: hypothetical protein ACE5GN_06355, partial [Waddliaceae bacterium]
QNRDHRCSCGEWVKPSDMRGKRHGGHVIDARLGKSSPFKLAIVLKGCGHPASEAQRRWAWSAEEKDELPEGTAHKWSKKVKGRKLPEHTAEERPVD